VHKIFDRRFRVGAGVHGSVKDGSNVPVCVCGFRGHPSRSSQVARFWRILGLAVVIGSALVESWRRGEDVRGVFLFFVSLTLHLS